VPRLGAPRRIVGRSHFVELGRDRGLEAGRCVRGDAKAADQVAVVVVVRPQVLAETGVALGLGVARVLGLAEGAHHVLELGRGHLEGQVDEAGLGVRRRDAADRPEPGGGARPLGERGAHERKLDEVPGDAHLVLRGTGAEAAAPRQEHGGRVHARGLEAPATVELGDQLEPATRDCVAVPGQRAELGLEALERHCGNSIVVPSAASAKFMPPSLSPGSNMCSYPIV